ncbi:MAG: hypothetical protein KDA61_15445, partial [Planctomycetales bacterium]|nr:hypothetical protein [Planctomycetales bacterium]
EALLLCEAAGYELVIVETVGVGQSETTVADLTDIFLALAIAGGGDELQGIKRGLLEWVDVLAVNKADGPQRAAAEAAAREYRNSFHAQSPRPDAEPPVAVTCSAREGTGVAELWETIAGRHRRMRESGALERLRQRQNTRWLWNIVDDALSTAVRQHPQVRAQRSHLEQQVAAGQLSSEAAAREVLRLFREA